MKETAFAIVAHKKRDDDELKTFCKISNHGNPKYVIPVIDFYNSENLPIYSWISQGHRYNPHFLDTSESKILTTEKSLFDILKKEMCGFLYSYCQNTEKWGIYYYEKDSKLYEEPKKIFYGFQGQFNTFDNIDWNKLKDFDPNYYSELKNKVLTEIIDLHKQLYDKSCLFDSFPHISNVSEDYLTYKSGIKQSRKDLLDHLTRLKYDVDNDRLSEKQLKTLLLPF